ncbi:threonine--tRNA ligase [Gimesia sp.]|uniref:threonine--tRNA ligase n=1 Tax=Gimesia sp. TaxID=2024833 RepID=UPI000C3D7FBC|nr:threonine--tRNA ligase [Gimesia sp.]MAX40723.1 threonine--tRNA ligase [Gimesia sp.]|tara:strand:- start:721 stop:2901 length:2181 start_codon:yes stop_codon:yes gene_type:complete
MIQIKLPDGTVKEYADDSSALDVAQSIGERLANAVVAAEVDGTVCDAFRPLKDITDSNEISLRLLTERDAEALGVMRHSCAHIMARAVMRLWPGIQLAFGPTLPYGFYYDFGLEHTISEDDFPKIEEEMKKIIKEEEPFERFSLDRDEAVSFVNEMDQHSKAEHIQTGLADHGKLSFYRQGEFVDLCRGPHIPNAGKVKAFKLLSIAGSYWKGDAGNKPLQRLYGTAWFNKKDMKQYLEQVEEAKRRDHRVLGKKLGLFSINPEVGQGLCLWLPKGATIRAVLEDFIKVELTRLGYQPVYSPHIGRVELYETSGHFPYYRDSQFAPLFGHDAGQLVDFWVRKLEEDSLSAEDEELFFKSSRVMNCDFEFPPGASREERLKILKAWEHKHERYLLKPMNCPHHAEMYKSMPRSYRDLPVRLAEFGTVYRHEQTGELNGMLRVRGLTQDDAHIFCTPEQVEEEFRATLELVKFVLASVGLDNFRVQLSLREPGSDKYVGSEENWQHAENSLRKVLEASGMSYSECEGEAAFYGPKADFMVSDCIGREWQLGTVQLDYNLPERFKLEYTGSDNHPHRPVMIHRAPFGSMERFTGMLIEHFAGAFPLWLAPEQIRVLPVSDKTLDYANEVVAQLRKNGFRVSIDTRSSKVNAKIRDAQLELIPYMFIVGPKEAEQTAVAVRDRIDGDLGPMPLADAIAKLKQEADERLVRQVAENTFAGVEGQTEKANEY